MSEDGIARALGRIVSGLYILTAGQGESAGGALVSFVQQAGFEPPTLTVAVRHDRDLADMIRSEQGFCISVVSAACKTLIGAFAKPAPEGTSQFEGVELRTTRTGVPYPATAHAFMSCKLVGEVQWSEHVLFCGEVIEGNRQDDESPMVHVRKNGMQY